RRAAIGACLQGATCPDLEVCLRMAACGVGEACPEAVTTRLAVDCYGICYAYAGGDRGCIPGEGDAFARCYAFCDEAALRLADAHRREYEACALDPGVCGDTCLRTMTCDADALAAPLAAAEGRCGVLPLTHTERYGCLGQVLQQGIATCLEDAACADLPACVEAAACGDDPGCLARLWGP
ncbi:MAG: hypothetical protein KC549_17270, partial [Myxococcales bacterium]|nr:hypothetical protein [Myxococcales bacterium]